MKFLKVPGMWLKACGHGSEDRIFPVLNIERRNYAGHKVTFVTVDRDGYRWLVHMETRGAQFVENSAPEPASTGADSAAVAVNNGGATSKKKTSYQEGREHAEQEIGDEFADYCDRSMRDLYE